MSVEKEPKDYAEERRVLHGEERRTVTTVVLPASDASDAAGQADRSSNCSWGLVAALACAAGAAGVGTALPAHIRVYVEEGVEAYAGTPTLDAVAAKVQAVLQRRCPGLSAEPLSSSKPSRGDASIDQEERVALFSGGKAACGSPCSRWVFCTWARSAACRFSPPLASSLPWLPHRRLCAPSHQHILICTV